MLGIGLGQKGVAAPYDFYSAGVDVLLLDLANILVAGKERSAELNVHRIAVASNNLTSPCRPQ